MKYPATFTSDPGSGFVVTFRDIPEAITQGDTEAEALEMAADVLLSAMDFYFDDRRQVPMPSKAEKGEYLIDLPLSVSAKVLLLNEMLNQHIRPAELARLLATTPQEVNRIIDLRYKTKIDRVSDAMHVLGKHIELQVA